MAELFGLDFGECDDGEMPVGAVLIVKYLDRDGDMSTWDQSVGLSPYEVIGMAEVYADAQRAAQVERRRPVDDD